MIGIAIHGVALFLFIPLVLVLFLRQPLGPGWSIATGLAIMVGHRFVAAPWAAKYADVRCLWCGRVGASIPFSVVAGGRTWSMRACSDEHLDRVTRVLSFLYAWRAIVIPLIFAPLAVLLGTSAAAATGWPHAPIESAASFFRIVVACTVVSAATIPFLVRPAGAGQPLRCPVPIHNLFLLGIRNTLWIFRIVGAWWIADGLWRLFR
jgi:hypothetical protein